MKKLLLMLVFCSLALAQLLAQSRVITGKVTDAEGKPVSNASVLVKGTKLGTSTNENGIYSITVPANAKSIIVSSVGQTSQEITIGAGNTINASLKAEDKNLDEVVVVAYGTVKKGENTSSSAQIKADDIKTRPLTNVVAALDGSAPGIQTLSANGQPGSAPSIRLRGFGSINASNDPLYVVDGVPYPGNINNINMDDVESITALKDAAGTALYGSRASNGVVVITTKKGKKGKPMLSFKATYGVSSRALPEYDRVDAYQYYPLMWQAQRNSLVYTSGQTLATASQNATNGIKTNLGYNPFNVANTDIVRVDGTLNPSAQLLWPDDLNWNKDLERNGSRQEYTVNYGGGNDKTDFYASFGYLNEKGFIIKSDFSKFSGRVNVNTQPLSWFKTGINIATTITNSNIANDGSSTGYVNPFFFTRSMGPIYPVYAHNQTTGDYLLDAQGQRFYDFGNFGGNTALGIPNRPAGASAGRHIVAETQLNNNLFKRNLMSGRTYADIVFTPYLKFTTNISIDLNNYYGSTYDNNIIGDGAPSGRASKQSTTTTAYTFNQLLNFNKKFGDHNISAMIGHENYDLNINDFTASRQSQVVTGNYDLSNYTTTNSVASQTDNQRIESYLGRANYDYLGKYFLSASIRRDGNSRFKKEFRWENFWSVGAAWRIDKEGFMQDVSWVNQLKLRASYGRVGNDAGIGYYPYQALYALGFNNNLEPGIRQSALRNDSITWEGSKSADIALDFSFFKNRLNGSIEYYHRTTDDLIFGVQLPLSAGGYVVNRNIGEMVNKGIEIQLNGDIVRNKNFTWNVGVNFSTLENEITKMPPNQKEIISGSKKLSVGHSIYDYWLRDWQGVDPTDGAALYRADIYNTTNSRIRGKNDTVTISQNNARFTYAGSAIPDFYGSISNSVKFKNFEFAFLLTYQVGGKIYDATYAGLMNAGTYGSAFHLDALKAWKTAGDVTNVPRMDNSKGGVFDAASTRWLTDASFLNIRTVTLSYDLPRRLLSKITANSGTFFINGENLGWFSKRKGMNVQQSFTGVTSNAFVPAKVITVGLNVNF